jgi:thioredoxin-related protein
MKTLILVAALALTATSKSFALDGTANWTRNVEQAWGASGTLDRPMIVFVTREGCLPCARMKTVTFVDRQVIGLIEERFVAIAMDGGRPSPLLNDLQVHAVPATFIISPRAVILERIEGFVSPEELVSRLNKVAPQWKPATPQPSTTARAF